MENKRTYSKKTGALTTKATFGKHKGSSLRGNCPTGKVRYRDHKEAIAALHRTQNTKARAIELAGYSKRAEKRAYTCDMCRGYHLTSWESQFHPVKESN